MGTKITKRIIVAHYVWLHGMELADDYAKTEWEDPGNQDVAREAYLAGWEEALKDVVNFAKLNDEIFGPNKDITADHKEESNLTGYDFTA